MSRDYTPVVNHMTRIIFTLIEDPVPYKEAKLADAPGPEAVRQFGELLRRRTERIAAMMDALAAKGFTFRYEKGEVFAESGEVEAQDAKNYLLSLGFQDREFQVFLEYARKWGML